MSKSAMKIDIRKIPNIPNLFEFTITTPLLRSQFRLPRSQVNQLRIMLEKVLVAR